MASVLPMAYAAISDVELSRASFEERRNGRNTATHRCSASLEARSYADGPLETNAPRFPCSHRSTESAFVSTCTCAQNLASFSLGLCALTRDSRRSLANALPIACRLQMCDNTFNHAPLPPFPSYGIIPTHPATVQTVFAHVALVEDSPLVATGLRIRWSRCICGDAGGAKPNGGVNGRQPAVPAPRPAPRPTAAPQPAVAAQPVVATSPPLPPSPPSPSLCRLASRRK
ncbi:hypothetical protein B0H14DRAFT_3536151 [Mycena olivaceomarginata]|nr:hypothetical protein B0H14DRAFT_3536151 [Mycena olivaceomarginata]